MSQPLIVPIDVRALPIGAATDLTAAANNFAGFPYRRGDGALSGESDYLAAAIGRYGRDSVNPGVRLHWLLPDALRRAVHENGELTFPAVPNRWLVTRFVALADTDGPVKPATRSWIIESDRVSLTAEGAAVTVPFASGARDGQYFRYLGRRFDHQTWLDEGMKDVEAVSFEQATGQMLTAVGHGDPAFSAYAPNCLNIFAMDDDFTEPGNELDLTGPLRIGYVVTGWYADGRGDPMQGASLSGDKNDLRWRWREDQSSPERAIFSGAVIDIAWAPGADTIRPLVTRSLDAAVAPTSAQALAAMLGADLSDRFADAELGLNAAMAGLLAKPDDGGGWVSELENELHRKSYVPHDGGFIWEAIDPRVPDLAIADAAARHQEVMLPIEAATALSVLNEAQRQYDLAGFAIAADARQLFFDWSRRQLLTATRFEGKPPWLSAFPDGPTDAVDDLIRAGLDALEEARAARGIVQIGRDDAGNDVPGIDQASREGSSAAALTTAWRKLGALVPNLCLKRLPAPRFWAPADPVILLRGDAARPGARGPQADDLDAGGYLPCRMGDQVVGLAAPNHAILIALPEPDVADVAARLIDEALILDGRFADWLDETRNDAAVPAVAEKESISPAAFSRNSGAQPQWLPLLMRWTIDFRSAAGTGTLDTPSDLDSGLLTQGHEIDPDRIDLRLNSAGTLAPPEPYTGWTVLSSNPQSDLTGALNLAGAADAASESGAVLADIQRAPVMAQAAGGFHEAMLMRETALQLKIFDPLEPMVSGGGKPPFSVNPAAARLSRSVGRVTGHAPDPTRPYGGVRSGVARLSAVQIVDVFGRTVEAALDRVDWARCYPSAARLGDADSVDQNSAAMPARFAQPSRIQVRWLAANRDDAEATGHPAASPICGWVLPNIIQRSLDLFAPDGLSLGSLRPVGTAGETVWQPAAIVDAPVRPTGDAAQQAMTLDQELADHPQLLALAKAILRTAGYRDAMMRGIDTALSTIVPQDHGSGLAMLFGRPLALVRARLDFELKGGAALDQGWPAFAAAAANATTGGDRRRNARGLAAVEVPVRLQGTARANDGLVGLFAEPDGYNTFLSSAITQAAPGIAPAPTLTVSADGEPVTVAMLIDPRAPIHAITGVLPVKTIGLPPSLYQAALDRMAVAFYAGPMLLPAGRTPVPVPRGPGRTWRWLRPEAGFWRQSNIAGPVEVAPVADGVALRLEEGWAALAVREIDQAAGGSDATPSGPTPGARKA